MRVYWGKSQPIDDPDASDYVAPDQWPKNNELLYRPVAIRILGVDPTTEEADYFLDTYRVNMYGFVSSGIPIINGFIEYIIVPGIETAIDPPTPSYEYGGTFSGGEVNEIFDGAGFYPDTFSNTFNFNEVEDAVLATLAAVPGFSTAFMAQYSGVITYTIVEEHHYKYVNGELIEI